MSLLAQVFPKLLTPKELVLKRLKGLASEHLSGTNEFLVPNTAEITMEPVLACFSMNMN